ILDMQMPIMDGLAATRAIRALDQGRTSVPIIAVTAKRPFVVSLIMGSEGIVS
ncbi:MAG: response regulator, partial [Betaproteobacteria bacterium]|nr:response regulator [Betaproteobacteria bacterium]